ncbi:MULTISPECIES: hypothetical protein [unclassified Microcoleus]|uniref:hypothetical protein n=1 Tax=unclassified Microcoleus TaxID=2642155 RepID=UPI002FD4F2CE
MDFMPLANCRIFYLEDDYFIADDTRETLTAAGAEVSYCATMPRALGLVERLQFDAALLDLNLAGKSSVPVARVLRQANVPFVFLTSYTREVLPDDLSTSSLLTKPSDGVEVVRELEKQLQLSGAHKGQEGCRRTPSDESDATRLKS